MCEKKYHGFSLYIDGECIGEISEYNPAKNTEKLEHIHELDLNYKTDYLPGKIEMEIPLGKCNVSMENAEIEEVEEVEATIVEHEEVEEPTVKEGIEFTEDGLYYIGSVGIGIVNTQVFNKIKLKESTIDSFLNASSEIIHKDLNEIRIAKGKRKPEDT